MASKVQSTVPASRHITVKSPQDTAIIKQCAAFLQDEEVELPARAANMNEFVTAIGKLYPVLCTAVTQEQLPEVDLTAFDKQLADLDAKVKDINAEATAKVATLVQEREALNQKIAAGLAPFEAKVASEEVTRTKVAAERLEALTPQREAIEQLVERLVAQYKNEVAVKILLSIDAPSMAKAPSSPGSRVVSSRTKVRVTKGTASHDCSSLASARRIVLEAAGGEEAAKAAYGVNAGNCRRDIERLGWSIEEL
jgi:hypothetical protein